MSFFDAGNIASLPQVRESIVYLPLSLNFRFHVSNVSLALSAAIFAIHFYPKT